MRCVPLCTTPEQHMQLFNGTALLLRTVLQQQVSRMRAGVPYGHTRILNRQTARGHAFIGPTGCIRFTQRHLRK